MDERKAHRYAHDNDSGLKTIEQHRSQQDQTLERIVSTSPIKFAGKYQTEPVENLNKLNSLSQVKQLFDHSNPLVQRSSVQVGKMSQHRRNKTEMSSLHKNKLKDPVFNTLFVPFLQTKSFDFGKSLKDVDKGSTLKRKAISNPKSNSKSFSGNLQVQIANRYSHREKKVSLPGIVKREGVRSSIQINEVKKSPVVKAATKHSSQPQQQPGQKAKSAQGKPFITTTSIGKAVSGSGQKGETFRLPIEAKNLRDFKAKDRENKLSSKRKSNKEKQWKEVNYLQLKTCYYNIDKKIASTSTIVNESNIKAEPNKDKDPNLKGLKIDLILHQRMPKVPKLPQVIQEVSLIIKNYHSIRKNKISIEKLIKSKQFGVKFVQKQFLYFGELKNQKFHGYGVLIKPDYIFEGEWKEGQKVIGAECKKGVFFEGELVQNKKIGFGLSYWNNGHDEYSGEWKDGLKNGNGIWKSLDGDQYIGQWVNGKVQGFGVHTTGDGQKYEGFFINFLKQGKGKQSFANGDEYEGNFLQGKPSGYGIYKFYRTQAVYEGNFQNGLRHGQGKLIVPSYFEYAGEFNMDNVSGYGKVTYGSNDSYLGNFKEGVRHGKGSLHKIKEKVILNGHWKNGDYFEKE